MASLRVECLRCGDLWVLHPLAHRCLDGGECPRCRYVGWAPTTEVSEATRRTLRERSLERRRLRVA
jgi:hypothetical protein